MGFVRRFGSFPGSEIISAIEGVVIVDNPPPGTVQGAGVGTVGLIGEFVDMTNAVVRAIATGVFTTKPKPVEVFSAQDAANKVGGFDATLGEFGISGGSGFVAMRNGTFQRLILIPVNLASALGLRLFRQLPTNRTATNPTPILPMAAALVPAGTEFKQAGNRVRTAGKVNFTSDAAYESGVDGSVTAAGGPAATQNFDSAGGDFINQGVKKGDILVLGVIGGAGALGANAFTYRVAADPGSATVLSVEKMDGSAFNWTTGNNLPWRLHVGATADSYGTGGAVADASQAQETVPCRPLDATIAATSLPTPTLPPPAGTATSWDPLSGLGAITVGAVVYTAAIQAPNAVSSASNDALYQAAMDSLLSNDQPGKDVNILVTARTSATIRAAEKAHVLTASSQGIGRVACISPGLDTQDVITATQATAPGVGATRDERVIFSWPGFQQSIPEAVGFSIQTALGTFTTDGILDCQFSMQMASLLSSLAPELNPGQAADPVPAINSNVLALQRGVSGLGMQEYILMKASGVAGLIMDPDVGPVVQSGVTSSLISGRTTINRRRMADFIQDSLASASQQFVKLPITQAFKDAVAAEFTAFMDELLSTNNPQAQRIAAYQFDFVSGNTQDLNAKGIYVVLLKVITLSTADSIVLSTTIGQDVQISEAA